MRLVKPSFEIIEQQEGLSGMMKHMELCGRTCYKSEDKITENSAEKFVNMIINRGHTAMLEHGTIYLKRSSTKEDNLEWAEKYLLSPFSEVSYGEGSHRINKILYNTNYITTNYRVLLQNGWLKDLQYQCEPTECHVKRITVKFICDRGVSHEFVRHRVFSFAQESTRYCNYSKNKFGNECTFIIPNWINEDELKDEFGDLNSLEYHKDIDKWQNSEWNDASNFLQSIAWSESNYFTLLENGWIAQQARAVLPNSLKTELIMTGTIDQWKGFFELRDDEQHAHPQAFELAHPLHEEFIKRGYLQ